MSIDFVQIVRRPVIVRPAVSAVLCLAVIGVVIENTSRSVLLHVLTKIPFGVLPIAALFLAVGVLASSTRVAMLAADLGHPLDLRKSAAALSLGNLAGVAFFQIAGQLMARGAFLVRHGMPLSTIVVLTLYERLLAAAVSVFFAVGAAWYLFGRVSIDMGAGGRDLFAILAGLLAAVAAGAWFAWGSDLGRQVAPYLSVKVFFSMMRGAAISAGIQACTMAAYIAVAHAIAPGLQFASLISATAIVMFCASVPISFAGWGVRELSAVFVLGAVGMPAQSALLVAVIIGSMSLLITAGFALVTARDGTASPDLRSERPGFDWTKVLGWVLPLSAATFLFFQLWLPVGSAVISVNLADPIAVIGGVMFLAQYRVSRQHWRLPHLERYIACATGVIAFGLCLGATKIGWTAWAIDNRALGWLVLLGYAATGALFVQQAGQDRWETLLRTFVAVGLAMAALDFIHILWSARAAQFRATGFSQNPNAFAFQLDLVAAIIIATMEDSWTNVFAAAAAFIAVWLTGSRGGLLALAAALVAGGFMRPRMIKSVLLAACCAVLAAAALLLLQYLRHAGPGSIFGIVFNDGLLAKSGGSSNAERMVTLQAAWEMFKSDPLVGEGLGVYYASTLATKPLVIHSTPMWLLAEFGIVGLLVFAAPFSILLVREIRQAMTGSPVAIVIVLVCVVFGVMSTVHELLYQRALWLLLGALVAVIPHRLAFR